MLAVVPDLNISVFSITVFDIISIIALVQFSLLRASYLYNSKGLGCHAYMGITHSPLAQSNGNLPLPFFGGNYPIFLLRNIY